MAVKQVNPYLLFNGKAEQAIKLYQSALGARTESLSRFGEVQGTQFAPEHRNRVMHALLRIGVGVVMLSDTMPNEPVPTQGNVEVCLDFDDVGEMRTRFEALSAGGKVRLPLQDTFWGATFGMLTDAFGIRWMLNCAKRG
ncbi:MAG TPA: VOC family protein [Anaeromyxobacteraceae bacterium]|nr:VOC family protein [Anaeromyxobacteraceae bacterium]